MSVIEELNIAGIRSYSPLRPQNIRFLHPLTLIWGKNGSGKTTVIEALRFVVCGELPPFSDRGKTFVLDPQLAGQQEVVGQVHLRFRLPNQVQVLATKIVKVAAQGKALKFSSLEQYIRVRDPRSGLEHTVNHQCVMMEKQIPDLLGVSKHIIDKVIFCHQEESLWPFEHNAVLKSIFDELFDTTQVVRMLDALADELKSLHRETRDLRTLIQAESELLQLRLRQRSDKVAKALEIARINNQVESLAASLPELLVLQDAGGGEDLSRLDNLHKLLRGIDDELAKYNLQRIDQKYMALSQQQVTEFLAANRRALAQAKQDLAAQAISAHDQAIWKQRLSLHEQQFQKVKREVEKLLRAPLDSDLDSNVLTITQRISQLEQEKAAIPALRMHLAEIDRAVILIETSSSLAEDIRSAGPRLEQLKKELREKGRMAWQAVAQMQEYLRTHAPAFGLGGLGLTPEESAAKVREYGQLSEEIGQLEQQAQRTRYAYVQLQEEMFKYVKAEQKCALCSKGLSSREIEPRIKRIVSSSLERLKQMDSQIRAKREQRRSLSPEHRRALASDFIRSLQREDKGERLSPGAYSQLTGLIQSARNFLAEAQTLVGSTSKDRPQSFKTAAVKELASALINLKGDLHRLVETVRTSSMRLASMEEQLAKMQVPSQRGVQQRDELARQLTRAEVNGFEKLSQLGRSYFSKVQDIRKAISCRPPQCGVRQTPEELEERIARAKQEISILQQVQRLQSPAQAELFAKRQRVQAEIEKITALSRGDQERRKQSEKQVQLRVKQERLRFLAQQMREQSLKDNVARLSSMASELEAKQAMAEDLRTYQRGVESTLLKFHQEKLQQINKIILDYWSAIYTGKDIRTIEIKSEEDQKARKNYQYRLVLHTAASREVDMKGHCSMGQKVLASLVVRLAIAEAFGSACGIFTLDEPTTNLDQDHMVKLAEQLNSLIEMRKDSQNFQLIIITHDLDFVRMLSHHAEQGYHVLRGDDGYSLIQPAPLKT